MKSQIRDPVGQNLGGGECLFLNNVPESVSFKISISAVFKKNDYSKHCLTSDFRLVTKQ